MSQAGLEEEIAVLEWRKQQAIKKALQDKEFSELPKVLYVTYIGSEESFMHTGRSRMAKKNPFRFQKGKALAMVQPEDIKFFKTKSEKDKNFPFKAEVMTEADLATKQAEEAQADADKKKAVADEKLQQEKEAEVFRKKQIKEEAAQRKAELQELIKIEDAEIKEAEIKKASKPKGDK